MEMSIKVLFGIVLVVITFLVILILIGGLSGEAGGQLNNFFGFLGGLEPSSMGG